LGEAIAAFLTDLLDNTAVTLHTDDDGVAQDGETRLPPAPILGADGRRRQFSLRTTTATTGTPASGTGFPRELGDLPAAALRALERMASASVAADQIQPSLARALNDVVVVEVLADRLMRRLDVDNDIQADVVTGLVARTLDYTIELAATRIEGKPVTHGVVLCADLRGRRPLEPRLDYPGRLPNRKRTPLLFDGTESALAVTATGAALGEINRASMPLTRDGRGLGDFDAALGMNGALIAAASASFSGVGVYLRSDGSIWIFDEGEPLFIRRTTRWKSIALANFSERLGALSCATSGVAAIVAQAVLRASIQGTGRCSPSPRTMPTSSISSPPRTSCRLAGRQHRPTPSTTISTRCSTAPNWSLPPCWRGSLGSMERPSSPPTALCSRTGQSFAAPTAGGRALARRPLERSRSVQTWR
jgi:hypothetical protein